MSAISLVITLPSRRAISSEDRGLILGVYEDISVATVSSPAVVATQPYDHSLSRGSVA